MSFFVQTRIVLPYLPNSVAVPTCYSILCSFLRALAEGLDTQRGPHYLIHITFWVGACWVGVGY